MLVAPNWNLNCNLHGHVMCMHRSFVNKISHFLFGFEYTSLFNYVFHFLESSPFLFVCAGEKRGGGIAPV